MILSRLNDDCLDQTMKYLQRQSVGRLSQVSKVANITAERELERRGKTRFQVGARYCTGHHSSSGVRTPFRIMRRTKKNVWFVNENRESRSPKPKRRKVFNYSGKNESFYEDSGHQNCVAAWGVSSNVIYSWYGICAVRVPWQYLMTKSWEGNVDWATVCYARCVLLATYFKNGVTGSHEKSRVDFQRTISTTK